jgi:hypothetical protein
MKPNDLNEQSPLRRAATLRMPLQLDVRHAATTSVSDRTMVALFDAYRSTGVVGRDELLRRIAAAATRSTRRGSDVPHRDGSVSFVWRGTHWWPLFQFDVRMSIRLEVARVAGELAAIFADWEFALWFVTPNAWLHDRSPIACVSTDGDATFQAARADRFIAVG